MDDDYHDADHPKRSFTQMDKLRRAGRLCDVSFAVESRRFEAHKIVLVSCSAYFAKIFLDHDRQYAMPIRFEDVEADAFDELLKFAYTSRVRITESNVHSLFHAADLLQFDGVKDACFRFLKSRLGPDNCIRMWSFARSHGCRDLIQAAFSTIENHFVEASRSEDFLVLDCDDIVEILTSDELSVTNEREVYDPVMVWFHHDPASRGEHLWTVLQHVRFTMLDYDYLMRISEEENLINEDEDCLDSLIEALELMGETGGRRLSKVSSYTWNARRPTQAIDEIFLKKDGRALGLRIMGGVDRPSHVFRWGTKPGIFILKIVPGGVAWESSLRVGDRLLAVNGNDIQSATHQEAVHYLSQVNETLTLTVRHETPPRGLKEVNLVANPGQGFGLSIRGGVNGYAGNPMDPNDEGIFISQIVPGGAAAENGQLHVGQRLLQVNNASLLHATHDEARRAFQEVVDRLSLLVCHGYTPPSSTASASQQPSASVRLGTRLSSALQYEVPKSKPP
ncbi:uncharacterized protein [Oscarella lobularis]|uniref:uncharacterized protein n=1 Tax=Oscarella lobularis TaxID=121494 RepID=UPI0033140408